MWWLLIIPIVFTPTFAYILHWREETEERREINRMADDARRKAMRSTIQFR